MNNTSTLDEQRINPCKRFALRFHEITYSKRTKELTSVMYLLAAEIEFITNILCLLSKVVKKSTLRKRLDITHTVQREV